MGDLVPDVASEKCGLGTLRSNGIRSRRIPLHNALSLRGLLSFHPPLHPINNQYEEMRGEGVTCLGELEAGESWDVSQCLACSSSCPVTGLVPGAGSRFVPTNEATRSHTMCGSDVCPHVDLYGESRYEYLFG